jgi:hypothetical protein
VRECHLIVSGLYRPFQKLTSLSVAGTTGGLHSPRDSVTPDVSSPPAGLSRVSPRGHGQSPAAVGYATATNGVAGNGAAGNGADHELGPFISPPRLKVHNVLLLFPRMRV